MVEDRALTTDYIEGLMLIDISDLVEPIEINSCVIDQASSVKCIGEYAFITAQDNDLQIVQISNEDDLRVVCELQIPGNPYGIDIAGNYAYIASIDSGLIIVDITHPEEPECVGRYFTGGNTRKVVVSDGHAFIADGESGLTIVNVTDPAEPNQVGSLDTPDRALGVAKFGRFIYIADRHSGLRIIDVADLNDPIEVGFYETPGSAHGVAVVGSLAFVAEGTNLGIYDCSGAMGISSDEFNPHPASFVLSAAFPNPFNNRATVVFTMPRPSEARLALFNPLGQQVKELTPSGWFPAGTHQVTFGADGLPSGDYLIRFDAGEEVSQQRVVLLK